MLTTAILAELLVRLGPDNPRWLEWRGKTLALITSAEHYRQGLKRETVSSGDRLVELASPEFTNGVDIRTFRQ